MLPAQKARVNDILNLIRLETNPNKDALTRFAFGVTKGENGKTPIKGVDYFTRAEIEQIIQEIVTRVMPLVTPIKGIHYNDGRNGKDGRSAKTPRKGQDYFTSADIIEFLGLATPIKGKHYFDGQDGKSTQPKDVIEALKKLKGKERLSVKDLQDTEFRAGRLLRGGGDTVLAGSGVSISESNGIKTISATGSGITFETPSGTVDSANKTFTVLNTPKYIVVDGITYFSGNGYSLVGLTITTVVPPTGYIVSAY